MKFVITQNISLTVWQMLMKILTQIVTITFWHTIYVMDRKPYCYNYSISESWQSTLCLLIIWQNLNYPRIYFNICRGLNSNLTFCIGELVLGGSCLVLVSALYSVEMNVVYFTYLYPLKVHLISYWKFYSKLFPQVWPL